MDMMPLVTIAGRDYYIDEEGAIEMRVLSLVPVVDKAGGSLNQGAALRYLNEIMWFPTAALSDPVSWKEIDASSAEATLDYAGLSVSAVFSFDDEGKIVTMTADRYIDEKSDVLPWSTPLLGYGSFDGVRMPVQGTGVWEYVIDGEFEYIRLELTDLEFDSAQASAAVRTSCEGSVTTSSQVGRFASLGISNNPAMLNDSLEVKPMRDNRVRYGPAANDPDAIEPA
ncbi:hypothetical protein BH23CHL5_BH23CHL5_15860 [soil metagenome]